MDKAKRTKVKRSNLRHETWTARASRSQYGARFITWMATEAVDDGESVRENRRPLSVQIADLHPTDQADLDSIVDIAEIVNARVERILERHLARKAKRKVPDDSFVSSAK